MTIEELAKAISDIQNVLNAHHKTIEDINKANETNQQTITDLMKTNNELMLSITGTKKEETNTEENEEVKSKLLDEYSEHFDEETLKQFIEIFE